MQKAIVVTGTAGTGKTVLAKKLAQALHCRYVSGNDLLKGAVFSKEKDGTKLVDVKKFVKNAVALIQKSTTPVVIDSHLSHEIQPKYVRYCIVTQCGLPVLKNRLRKRRYAERKIGENLQAEAFETCLIEALENGHRVILVNTRRTKGIKEVLAQLKQ